LKDKKGWSEVKCSAPVSYLKLQMQTPNLGRRRSKSESRDSIDIKSLTLGILMGVPHSATSFYQRIGRIGRSSKGEVVIINTGDVHSESIFKNPKNLFSMPLSEGALYLENPRIQYIHALCMARQGGEHDQVCNLLNRKETTDLDSSIDFPANFLELCHSERIGVIPAEFQSMKSQAGEDPHHTFPLRDVDVQFQIEHKKGPYKERLGSLSYAQLMREAYPGAIYYYITRPYRVFRVGTHTRLVEVRMEKKYTTKPQFLPTLVFPNLTSGNVYQGYKYNNLTVLECNLQIREAIKGIIERRGPTPNSIDYPLERSLGYSFDQPRFTRNYFTTGIVLTHPVFNDAKVHCDIIARLLFESFLMVIPFERRDLNSASDKHRVAVGTINENDKFISIYDQTYGSLRLSGRLLEERVLRLTILKCVELAKDSLNEDINIETLTAIEVIYNELSSSALEFNFQPDLKVVISADKVKRVILPGSKGLNIGLNNQEFLVKAIFFSPEMNGLVYRCIEVPQQGSHTETNRHGELFTIILVDSLVEIPGESKMRLYHYDTGELTEL
jgi:DEAD/DEAH box helicase domain-containing protein